jgi:hypothetical protein
MLEESRVRGEVRSIEVEAVALMVLSLTESYVLSARVLGQTEAELTRQAAIVARSLLYGIGEQGDSSH